MIIKYFINPIYKPQMDHISNTRFSEEQTEIINLSTENSLKIISGPGTGKTYTLLAIIHRLLSTKICKPNEILLTTFNVESRRSLKHLIQLHLGNLTAIYGSDVCLFNIDQLPYHKEWSYEVRNFVRENYKSLKQMYIYLRKLLENDDFRRVHFNLKYILFDEFQDISEEQYELLMEMYRRIPGVRMIVAGDEGQNIYEFRYTNFSYFKDKVMTDVREMRECRLTTNYRCSLSILSILNTLIAGAQHIQKYQMKPQDKGQQSRLPLIMNYANEDVIVDLILEKLKRYEPQNIAVLSFTRINQSNLIFHIDHHNRQSQRISNQPIIKYYTPISKNKQQRKHKIFIGSVHQSKGLEFDAIILLGCEDQSFPFNYKNIQRKEEARRLLYVAISRCSRDLTIALNPGSQLNYFLSCIPNTFYRSTAQFKKQNMLIFNPKSNQTDYWVTEVPDLLNGIQAHKIQTIFFNFDFIKNMKTEQLSSKVLVVEEALKFSDWERIFGIIFDRFVFREISRRLNLDIKDEAARRFIMIEQESTNPNKGSEEWRKFLDTVRLSISFFEAKELNSMDILPSIVAVSLAGGLNPKDFHFIRKRKIQNLLQAKGVFNEFRLLAQQVYENVDLLIEKYQNQQIQIKPQLYQRFYRGMKNDMEYEEIVDMRGEIDMIVDNKIILDLKLNSSFDFNSSIQLMLYKSMKDYQIYKTHSQNIQTLAIYNILQNQIQSVDVSKWYNQAETLDKVVDYLIENEKQKMEKYAESIILIYYIVILLGIQLHNEIEEFLNKYKFTAVQQSIKVREMSQQIFVRMISEGITQENIQPLVEFYKFNILHALNLVYDSKNILNIKIFCQLEQVSDSIFLSLYQMDSKQFKIIQMENKELQNMLHTFLFDTTEANSFNAIQIEIEDD